METHRDRILHYLSTHPTGVDDDLLARDAGIPRRQTANAICRQLAEQALIIRQPDPGDGKIVNRLAAHVADRPDASAPARPAAPTMTRAVPSRIVRLADEAALRRFGYVGQVGLTEDWVKRAVEGILRAAGWLADVRWGRTRGIDIDARRGHERLVIGAKGKDSYQQMRLNYFLAALGELLQHMDEIDARYALALPAHRQFVDLMLDLPAWVRAHLGLCFFLARPASDGSVEVGVFPPEGYGR